MCPPPLFYRNCLPRPAWYIISTCICLLSLCTALLNTLSQPQPPLPILGILRWYQLLFPILGALWYIWTKYPLKLSVNFVHYVLFEGKDSQRTSRVQTPWTMSAPFSLPATGITIFIQANRLDVRDERQAGLNGVKTSVLYGHLTLKHQRKLHRHAASPNDVLCVIQKMYLRPHTLAHPVA